MMKTFPKIKIITLNYLVITGELYENFKNQLIKEKKGVNGLITRRIAETPSKYINSGKVIYFVGLNALSESEETIVNYLTKNNSQNYC